MELWRTPEASPVAPRDARQVLDDVRLVIRYTRYWLHYGIILFTLLCSIIAAVRGVAAASFNP